MTTPHVPIFPEVNPVTGALPALTERRFAKPTDLVDLASQAAVDALDLALVDKADGAAVDKALADKADADAVASALAGKVDVIGAAVSIATYRGANPPAMTEPAIAALPDSCLIIWAV